MLERGIGTDGGWRGVSTSSAKTTNTAARMPGTDSAATRSLQSVSYITAKLY